MHSREAAVGDPEAVSAIERHRSWDLKRRSRQLANVAHGVVGNAFILLRAGVFTCVNRLCLANELVLGALVHNYVSTRQRLALFEPDHARAHT